MEPLNAFYAGAAPGKPPIFDVPGTPYALIWNNTTHRYDLAGAVERVREAFAVQFGERDPSAKDVRNMAWWLLGFVRGLRLARDVIP